MGDNLGSWSFSELVDRAFRLYRRNFGPWFGLMLLLSLPFILFSIDFAQSAAAARAAGAPPGGWSGGLAPLMVLSFAAMLVQYGTLGLMAHGAYLGQPVRPGEALKRTLRRSGALVVGFVLSMLAIMPAMVLLIVPGIYVATGFSMFIIAALEENLGGVAALKRSWRLAKGMRMRVFGVMLVWAVVGLVLNLGSGALVGLVTPSVVVKTLVEAVANGLVGPLFPTSLALLYLDARARKEGLDLQLEAERVLGNAAGSPRS